MTKAERGVLTLWRNVYPKQVKKKLVLLKTRNNKYQLGCIADKVAWKYPSVLDEYEKDLRKKIVILTKKAMTLTELKHHAYMYKNRR